uniref:Transmembrane protein n=1 Tax=Noccaea caerulescens TaxID=107243 RepID=A0A1J3H0X7_NOCCA
MGDQGVQQMQQPVVVYPNTYPKQYPDPSSSSSSSGSRGSFGTVFIVLAVILVLSVVACVFGRLCNRERGAAKQQHIKHPKHEKGSSKKSREIRPVEREPRERGDLEFGLDMKRPGPFDKPSGRDHGEDIEFGFDNKRGERGGGGGGGGPPPPSIKHGVRFKLPENGDHHGKGEIRRGGPDFEFRPGHQ